MERFAYRLVFFLGAIQLFWFVHVFAVNIFYFDAWDLYFRFFESESPLALFLSRFGLPPARPGLGLFLAKACLLFSDWNARVESFAIAGCLVVAAAGMGFLVSKQTARRSFWDLILLSHLLALASWETLVGTPVSAFGAVPYLLVVLLGGVLFVENTVVRNPLLAVLSAVMIFCTYGFLAFPAVLFLLLRDTWRAQGGKELLVSVGSAVLLILAFAYYVLSAWPQSNAQVPVPFFQFLQFIGSLTVSTFGWYMYVPVLSWVGIVLFIGFLILGAGSAWLVMQSRRAYTDLLFLFLSWTIFFILLSAYGRAGLGVRAALTSRYFVYLLPGYVAVFLLTRNLPKSILQQTLLTGLVVSHLAMQAFLYLHQLPKVRAEMVKRQEIVECLKERKSIEQCQVLAKYEIHPDIQGSHIQEKIDLLRSRHLGPFKFQ